MKIEIKDEFIKKIENRIKQTDEFKSVEEYVNYIIEQVVSKLENKKEESKPVFSKEDEEKVKDKLRGLGYLD
ncbi:CopG family transcriptional regulator [Candidatus Woesearchaeota archaeon]|nr:CopG family transcriptional regulator [Candidatus Woesearchaeota archaeon]